MSGAGTVGLWMLLVTALAMALSGLPAWIVLVGTSLMFTVGGLLVGVFPLALLWAIPSRLLGLLEHDLLQALPLYVLMGALLNHLPLASVLNRVVSRMLRRTAAAPYLSGLTLGALLAPMNGSVGASVAMLSRTVLPRLDAARVPVERGAALICTASTIGVVVPPSLVLILLGDAMLRAHTEALNATGQGTRVVNTQDIFHGALVPAAVMLVLLFAVTWWRNRGDPMASADEPVTHLDWLTATLAVLCLAGLLLSVTLGYLYAVEAAASGGVALVLYGMFTRALNRATLRAVLHDTLLITGALFAVLMAATVYTFVLRAFETDVWMTQFLLHLSGGPTAALCVVLLLMATSAFVLDAFEIIFVIVPVVMAPLLMLQPDAVWVAVLTLLVLQASFLLPPFGYAVLMAGSVLKRRLRWRELLDALWPYLLVQLLVLSLVLGWPNLLWRSHSTELGAPTRASNAGTETDDGGAQLRELLDQQAPAADDAASGSRRP